MSEHPIENLMITAMSSLRDMIDVNTIVGDTVEMSDGTVIIPVSKVSFGFAAGGSEFNNKNPKMESEQKLPFGGGSGAGVNISPIAFLIVKDTSVKLLNIDANRPLDKLMDLAPDVINKIIDIIGRSFIEPKPIIQIEDNKNV